jgi:hypothetical protein
MSGVSYGGARARGAAQEARRRAEGGASAVRSIVVLELTIKWAREIER